MYKVALSSSSSQENLKWSSHTSSGGESESEGERESTRELTSPSFDGPINGNTTVDQPAHTLVNWQALVDMLGVGRSIVSEIMFNWQNLDIPTFFARVFLKVIMVPLSSPIKILKSIKIQVSW